jgi:hypothetical protein
MEVDQEKEGGAATQATNEEKNASLLLGLAMGDGGGSRSLPGAGRPCVSSYQSAGGSATCPQPEVKDVTAAGTIAKGSADPASESCPDWASEMVSPPPCPHRGLEGQHHAFLFFLPPRAWSLDWEGEIMTC